MAEQQQAPGPGPEKQQAHEPPPKSKFEAPPQPTADEIEKAKGTAWLSYLGILWLIPLLTLKENNFAKWHVKQGIVLSIYWAAVIILGSIIPFVGWFVILPVGAILVTVFEIIGIIKSLQGQMWMCGLGVKQLAAKFKF